MYSLDALCQIAKQKSDTSIFITIYEPSQHLGAGKVYELNQPEYLLMNYTARQIDAWDNDLGSRQTIQRDFCAWARIHSPEYSGPNVIVPRFLVGKYLTDCYDVVIRNLPVNVVVHVRNSIVTQIENTDIGWSVKDSATTLEFDNVIIATGHQDWKKSDHVAPFRVYPVDKNLGLLNIPPGSIVTVKGFGLTWIDAVLALTLGRKGRFLASDRGLAYSPSSQEPKQIRTFARTIRPMLCKPMADVEASLLQRSYDFELPLISFGHTEAVDIARIDKILDIVMNLADQMSNSDPGTSSRDFSSWCRQVPSPDEVISLIKRSYSDALSGSVSTLGAIGLAWRTLYPNIVQLISHQILSEKATVKFARITREMERIAFGPPAENLAKIIALIDNGIVQPPKCLFFRNTNYTVNATLPTYQHFDPEGPIPGLIQKLNLRLNSFNTLAVSTNNQAISNNGNLVVGLFLVGRMTEYSVLGNDSLNRSLHPQIRKMAEEILS